MSGELPDWTTPFYLQFLQGNFVTLLSKEEQTQFVSAVRRAMTQIDDRTIAELLVGARWRERLSGAWFSGLLRRTEFQEQIGSRLIESSCCFSGQGYVFALAACANQRSSELLKAYLDKWLPKLECEYDQDWAMPALAWLDVKRGREDSKPYLKPGGLWEQFVADKTRIAGFKRWHFEVAAGRFARVMEFCCEHFGSPPRPGFS